MGYLKSMSNETYLVFCATGRQGSAVTHALSTKGAKSIVVSSRDPSSPSIKKLLGLNGVTKAVKADLKDPESILAAIDESGATRVWFTTDWYSIKKPTRAKEAKLGYNVIDAIKKRQSRVNHVVFNSGAYADEVPAEMEEFWSKADVEKYMEKELDSSLSSQAVTTWAVLRPVAFLENLDDARNSNPLTKGRLKMLTKPDCSLKYISTKDIGKGSAALLMESDTYAGKKVDAATCEYTGVELAAILSEVSGTTCNYRISVPRIVLYVFARNVYHLVTWFEQAGYVNTDIDEFKKIVPDCQDAKAWFTEKGQWANGKKFAHTEDGKQ